MTALPDELLTDRYQFTMADSYLAEGTADGRVAFELFVRRSSARSRLDARRGPGPSRSRLLAGMRFGDAEPRLSATADRLSTRAVRFLERPFHGRIDASPKARRAAGSRWSGSPGRGSRGQLVERCSSTRPTSRRRSRPRRPASCSQPGAARPAPEAPWSTSGRGAPTASSPRGGRTRRHLAASAATGERRRRDAVGHAARRHDGPLLRDVPTRRARRLQGCMRDQPANAAMLVDTYDSLAGEPAAVEAARETGIRPSRESGSTPATSWRCPATPAAARRRGMTATMIVARRPRGAQIAAGRSGAPIERMGCRYGARYEP